MTWIGHLLVVGFFAALFAPVFSARAEAAYGRWIAAAATGCHAVGARMRGLWSLVGIFIWAAMLVVSVIYGFGPPDEPYPR